MSAWDVTGLLIWGYLACSGWSCSFQPGHTWEGTEAVLLLAVTAAAIFCAARLLGAHL